MGNFDSDPQLEPQSEAWLNNLKEPAVWLDMEGQVWWLNAAAAQAIPSPEPYGKRLEDWFQSPERESLMIEPLVAPWWQGTSKGVVGIPGPRWRWFQPVTAPYGRGQLCILTEVTREYNQALAYHSSLEVFLGLLTQDEHAEELFTRILNTAVEVVPGAEAGSLLMLEEKGFRFAAQIGFDEGLYNQILDYDYELAWYGLGIENWNQGKPRLLVTPQIQERTEKYQVKKIPLFVNQGKLESIKANITVPVVLQGRVMATLNLDSFTSTEAFAPESLAIAQTFAVQMAAVIYGVLSRDHLSALALTDALTGLGNRHALEESFSKLKAQSSRLGLPLTMIYWDMDDLKDLNDRYGHSAGDQALKILAAALQGTSRQSDSSFRIGGDEFVSLHLGMPMNEAAEYIHRVRNQMHVSVSAGAIAITTMMDLPKALILSDEAMYHDKRRTPKATEAI